jgi:hypothetical protein
MASQRVSLLYALTHKQEGQRKKRHVSRDLGLSLKSMASFLRLTKK